MDGGVLVVDADEEVGEEGGGCVACEVVLVGEWRRGRVEGENGGWWAATGMREEMRRECEGKLTACDEAVVVWAEAGLVEVGEDVGLEVCCES